MFRQLENLKGFYLLSIDNNFDILNSNNNFKDNFQSSYSKETVNFIEFINVTEQDKFKAFMGEFNSIEQITLSNNFSIYKKNGLIENYDILVTKTSKNSFLLFFNDFNDLSSNYEYRALKEKSDVHNKTSRIFLSSLNHQIRNPLQSIFGFAELIDQSLNTNEKNLLDYINGIKISVKDISILLENIFDLNAIYNNQIIINQERFNLNKVLSEINKIYSPMLVQSGIDFNTELERNLNYEISGDRFRLQLIISNLLNNSINFSKFGKVKLSIDFENLNDDQIHLILKFSDSNIYLNKENISLLEKVDPILFESFNGNNITKEFNFFYIRKISDSLNGSFSVESNINFGTKIKIEIPFQKHNIQNIPKQESVSSVLAFEGKKILLAEDNPTNQLLIKKLLQNLKIEVDVVENGNEALKLLKINSYDLALFDVKMPIMDGLDAAKLWREFEKQNNLKTTPILALTAQVLNDDLNKCFESGMDDILGKPINIDEFKQKLKLYLEFESTVNNSPIVPQNVSIINYNYIDSIANGDLEFRNEILKSFLIDANEYLQQMNVAVSEEKWTDFQHYAHKAKGPFSVIQFNGILDKLAYLEKYNPLSKRNDILHIYLQDLKLAINLANAEIKVLFAERA